MDLRAILVAIRWRPAISNHTISNHDFEISASKVWPQVPLGGTSPYTPLRPGIVSPHASPGCPLGASQKEPGVWGAGERDGDGGEGRGPPM